MTEPFARLDFEALSAIPFDADWSDTRERRAYAKRVAEAAMRSCEWQLKQRAAPASQAAVSQWAGEDAEEPTLADARRYKLLRRGQHWSVINGIGDTLRGEQLDAAVDAARLGKGGA